MEEKKTLTLQNLRSYLSPGQIAKKYPIARQNILIACKAGKFTEQEAVETSLGWLISPEGAERLWGNRK